MDYLVWCDFQTLYKEFDCHTTLVVSSVVQVDGGVDVALDSVGTRPVRIHGIEVIVADPDRLVEPPAPASPAELVSINDWYNPH